MRLVARSAPTSTPIASRSRPMAARWWDRASWFEHLEPNVVAWSVPGVTQVEAQIVVAHPWLHIVVEPAQAKFRVILTAVKASRVCRLYQIRTTTVRDVPPDNVADLNPSTHRRQS